MVLNKTILILEDNLETLSKILDRLATLEGEQPYDFSPIILTNYIQVKEFLNRTPEIDIDIILLDRDCKLNGSFHVLEIEKLGAGKVIAISSVPEFNEEVMKRGVKRVVLKDNRDKDGFADKVVKEIAEMLRNMPITKAKTY